jgi:hypothetical protein
MSVEEASDEQFQVWADASNLLDLIDDGGIAAWSFDDRCRLINFAIQQGRQIVFEDPNNSDLWSGGRSGSELFDDPPSA